MAMKPRPLLERLIEKIVITPNCWLWRAAKDRKGYGVIGIEGKMKTASRVAYTLLIGAIPDGMCVLHKCDNPACVKPSHLFLGTQADNMRDMTAKGRNHETKKTHCPQGHPYNELNTYRKKNGGRACRICTNTASRRYNEKKRRLKQEVA